MFIYSFCGLLLLITLTKSQLTLNFTNTTDLLIKENATSNYFYSTFDFGTRNVSVPYAIGQCSTYNILNGHLKAECISRTLLNVTYYNQFGCAPDNVVSREIINDTTLFRCDVGSNYATVLMSVGTACPGIFDLAVAVGYCHYTGSSYATFLCENNYLQYVYYSDNLCSSPNLMAINDANNTCEQFFTVNSIDIYGSAQKCVTDLTSTFVVVPTTTEAFMTTNINATNVNATSFNASAMQSTASTITTSHPRTTSAGAHATNIPATTRRRRRRIIPGIPTIAGSGASTIFNFNNIVFIILIGSIVNILC